MWSCTTTLPLYVFIRLTETTLPFTAATTIISGCWKVTPCTLGKKHRRCGGHTASISHDILFVQEGIRHIARQSVLGGSVTSSVPVV